MSQDLWSRLEQHAQDVADRALHAYVAASPRYESPGVPEHLYRNMAVTCRGTAHLCARMAREGREATDRELDLFREKARDRGAEGLPVADYVDACFYTGRALWDVIVDLADGVPPPDAAAIVLRCMQQMQYAAVEAHQEEYQAVHSDAHEAMRLTVDALVTGQPVAEYATRNNLPLAPSYTVVALAVAAHPSESQGDAVGRRLAKRRKVHHLTAHLQRALREDSLISLEPEGGLILLPSRDRSADVEAVRAAMPGIARAADAAVRAGCAHAARIEDVVAAAEEARRLVEMADVPGRVVVLEDDPFAYHVRHPSAATPLLSRIAAQLRSEPDLARTAEAYLDHDLSRTRTAQALHIHPNSVDNRLTRIRRLTGVDPRTARGLLLIGAALAATPAFH